MKALVVGYGSIGQRHARILKMLGCTVGIVSRRLVDHPDLFHDLVSALDTWNPEYVVLANKTYEHYEALSILAKHRFSGMVMVEKPLFHKYFTIPENQFSSLCLAYNLRFHPLLEKLHDFLRDQRSLIARAYVGQYLPEWRPSSDYRNSYSAKRTEGGGVLRDLSHELDYMNWLFGGWHRLTAFGGHFSDLEIESDDSYDLLLEMRNCPLVSIHVNYLDRVVRREIIVNTDEHTCKIDFINGTISIDRNSVMVNIDKDSTYLDEHKAMLSGDFSRLCTAQEGLDLVKMIECAERASEQKIWVEA